jgi:hypothetical protein
LLKRTVPEDGFMQPKHEAPTNFNILTFNVVELEYFNN